MRDIYVVHIPKTAGKTLIKNLKRHLPSSKISSLYQGHQHYGFHKLANPIVIVVLRNPIKRWLSTFDWVVFRRGFKDRLSRNYIKDIFTSFPQDQFVQQCIEQGVCTNVMTKMIAGIPAIDSYKPQRGKTKKFTEEEMGEIFDTAKKNLLSFEHVGFQENFPAFYASICKAHRFPTKIYHSYHTKKHKIQCPFSEDDVYKLNEYDVALYKFAQAHVA